MSEIIVISDDDDLEEGEIADDIIPEPVINNCKPKDKKLPRRYILHENKSLNSKHTKHRKHSSRHHRKHHKSCPHRSVERHKLMVKQLGHKKDSLQSGHRENGNGHASSISGLKSAFKNFSSPRREPVAAAKHNSNNQLPVKNLFNSEPITSSEKTPKELKENGLNLSNVDIQKEEPFLPKCMPESKDNKKLNLLPTQPISHELIELEICSETMVNEESEDEDEEELRRIALSTCLNRPVMDIQLVSDKPVASSCEVSSVDITAQNSSSQMSGVVSKSIDTYLSDNYEVVDMELDDDSLSEEVNNDNLFVIDRNPLVPESHNSLPDHHFKINHNADHLSRDITVPCLENKLNSNSPSSQFHSNDDFEEELLRAEVIASMNLFHKKSKKVPAKKLSFPKSGTQNQVQLPPTNKVHAAHNMKIVKNLPTYCKPLKPNFLNMTSRRVVNKAKLNYSKLLSQKKTATPSQRKINAGPERLVITLNNDSSSEESDEECDKNKDTQENVAVASIEALISDARQKSDFQKSNSNDSNSVSCLSKAQQEEYNALKQILAQKQVLPKRSSTINDKRTLHLKILTKKISVANDNLSKERKMLNDAEKELLLKKQEYMTSKLKAQHLKEQLHAAELVRAANLQSWKKSAAKLDIQKKSVTKHEAIVDLLEKRFKTESQPQVRNSVLSPIQRIDSLAT